MIKEGNIFNKTVVLLINGEEANTIAKVMCEAFSTAGYITDIFKIKGIIKSFCLLLGWDGWEDEKGKKLLSTIGKAGLEFNPDCWISLLNEKIQDDPRYPFDIIFIPDYETLTEKLYLESNPTFKVMELFVREYEQEVLGLDEDNLYYAIKDASQYSKLLDKCNTIVENILSNFSIERKSEEIK